LGAIYSEADPPPTTSRDKFMVRFKDGALLEYDRASHTLTVSGVQKVVMQASAEILLQAGGKVTVDSPDVEFSGNVLVKGKLVGQGGLAVSGGAGSAAVIRGDVRVDGDVSASGSVMDAGGNSNHHSH
ncbi:phage baseplate assembly protein V, partial [Chromobacterium violaceum]